MGIVVTRNISHLLFIPAQTQSLKQLNFTNIIAHEIDKLSLYIGESIYITGHFKTFQHNVNNENETTKIQNIRAKNIV